MGQSNFLAHDLILTVQFAVIVDFGWRSPVTLITVILSIQLCTIPLPDDFINAFALKQLLASLIIVAFLAQTFSRQLIVAAYYSNSASFAKNCENKARPMMHCNGKCQLMKKLKQEEKKEQQNQERRGENDEVLSSKSFFSSIICFSFQTKPVYNSIPVSGTVTMPRFCFHPPSA